MAYKTILAVLDTPQNARQISDFSISLARHFSAHLIGVHAETLAAVPLIAPMEIPDPAAVQVLQEAAEKESAEVQRIFGEQAASAGVSTECRSFISSAGFGSNSVMETARSVDLIVASQSDPGHADHRADLETFLFESGRPMLLIPYKLKVPQPIKRVLVAWNGSREAARATFDAMPFLKAAETVELLTIDPPERGRQALEPAGTQIAATLRRHGIQATLTTHTSGGEAPAAVIEKRLADNSIDLLVMGGYGHSRWWEMLFGGATRSLLDSMSALTLLSR
ncbi:universal stress protein [Neorhizobium sp. SOG26]|jgi:Universal stress protein UspA and related nucleotide-binding proteins|uniref:Universal stress protein n=1 Tax=Neorhizobium turbinariae TaxID=2937795 RepID=A0ABT0ISM0_9HYPH|nr:MULTISPECIES: universal stress protein [Neorhizobium]AXV15202.1 universal stress protein [Neorhizobium sp. SOG26]MCK8780865.1 universal stress protein [Neorhizobium turbinariae]